MSVPAITPDFSGAGMEIRVARQSDFEAMWAIFKAAIATGDTLPFAETFEAETFRGHWFESQTPYVAVQDGRIVGLYKIGANFPDLGAHVASATYVVDPLAQGRGVGRGLVEHSLARARSDGFLLHAWSLKNPISLIRNGSAL